MDAKLIWVIAGVLGLSKKVLTKDNLREYRQSGAHLRIAVRIMLLGQTVNNIPRFYLTIILEVAREQLTRQHAFSTARERPFIKNSKLKNQRLQSPTFWYQHGKLRSVHSS